MSDKRTIHYQETLDERRARLHSTTLTTEGTLCSNGSRYSLVTRIWKLVTCSKCREIYDERKNTMD